MCGNNALFDGLVAKPGFRGGKFDRELLAEVGLAARAAMLWRACDVVTQPCCVVLVTCARQLC